MTLSSLIKRLEEAEGPSRELDAHIRCTLLAPADSYVEQSKFNGEWLVYKMWADGRARLLEPHQFSVPRDLWRGEYTGSVDAAISLAERVLNCVSLTVTIDPSGNGCTIAWWPMGLAGGLEIDTEAVSTTPAIAIVLATLRAIQSKGDKP